jgi:hypothetical protein
MHGAVFGTMVVAIIVVLLAGLTPFILIPIVVIGLGALVAIPMLSAVRDSRAHPTGAAPSGVPTTSEASYDPVRDAGRQSGA